MGKIVKPDAAGRYVDGKDIFLRRAQMKGPSGSVELVLPAGEYGIVELLCSNLITKHMRQYFHARVATGGDVITGQGTVYQQPIAKFSVLPGQIVDVGSINVETVRGPNAPGHEGEFAVTVSPIGDDWLRRLAAAKPQIYAVRVQHLMRTPGQARVTSSRAN